LKLPGQLTGFIVRFDVTKSPQPVDAEMAVKSIHQKIIVAHVFSGYGVIVFVLSYRFKKIDADRKRPLT
jgi:hypothetical protein